MWERIFWTGIILMLVVIGIGMVLNSCNGVQTTIQDAEWPNPELTEQISVAKFSKGQVLSYYDIEPISGVCDGQWYDMFIDETGKSCVIVKMDIEIEIIVRIKR